MSKEKMSVWDLPFATKEEREEDERSYKEDESVLKEFYQAARNKDTNKLQEKIEIIEKLPFLTQKRTSNIFPNTYESRPWKARDLDEKELMLTEMNEEIHPYLTKFFDIAVRENMTKMVGLMDDFPRHDGNYEIALWLEEYAKTSVLLQNQGKEICVPETFEEYPILKQFVYEEVHKIKKVNDSGFDKNEEKEQTEIGRQIEKVRRRLQSNTVSGVVVADEIAEDMINGKEKRTITREVGKELSDKIKKEYALSKKQKE